MVSHNQARANNEDDVIGTWFDLVEITRSNRGSRRGKSEAAEEGDQRQPSGRQHVGRGTRVM